MIRQKLKFKVSSETSIRGITVYFFKLDPFEFFILNLIVATLCKSLSSYFLLVARLESPKGLMVFAQNFGDVVGTYKGYLPLSESRWGGDSTWRWWRHLITILCNQTHLNYLH